MNISYGWCLTVQILRQYWHFSSCSIQTSVKAIMHTIFYMRYNTVYSLVLYGDLTMYWLIVTILTVKPWQSDNFSGLWKVVFLLRWFLYWGLLLNIHPTLQLLKRPWYHGSQTIEEVFMRGFTVDVHVRCRPLTKVA